MTQNQKISFGDDYFRDRGRDRGFGVSAGAVVFSTGRLGQSGAVHDVSGGLSGSHRLPMARSSSVLICLNANAVVRCIYMAFETATSSGETSPRGVSPKGKKENGTCLIVLISQNRPIGYGGQN